MDFPQFAVSKWIGHSIEVSGKHYANDVPDELFDRAAHAGESAAVQNPAQQPAEPARKLSQTENDESEQDDDNPVDCEALRISATRCEQLGKWSRGESNPRASAQNLGKTSDSGRSGAESGAQRASEGQFEPDLQRLIDAWPTLPDALKTGILAMVTAATRSENRAR